MRSFNDNENSSFVFSSTVNLVNGLIPGVEQKSKNYKLDLFFPVKSNIHVYAFNQFFLFFIRTYKIHKTREIR